MAKEFQPFPDESLYVALPVFIIGHTVLGGLKALFVTGVLICVVLVACAVTNLNDRASDIYLRFMAMIGDDPTPDTPQTAASPSEHADPPSATGRHRAGADAAPGTEPDNADTQVLPVVT